MHLIVSRHARPRKLYMRDVKRTTKECEDAERMKKQDKVLHSEVRLLSVQITKDRAVGYVREAGPRKILALAEQARRGKASRPRMEMHVSLERQSETRRMPRGNLDVNLGDGERREEKRRLKNR